MLSTTSFIRKTKRGSVLKVVKEHYLRDDIYCGIPECCHCPNHATTLTSDQKEIMIPDTNMLYHQIDIMEHNAIYNVVVLQTTLEELRNRSLAVYNRVRALIADPEKRFYVFSNEHHYQTYIKKEKAQTINDRNDQGIKFNFNPKAIRLAVKWYKNHIPIDYSVLLVTDDAENRALSEKEGLSVLSVKKYVESKRETPELIDMIAAFEEDTEKEIFKYQEHLTSSQISAGLKSGAFHQGTLSISNHNFLEGSVLVKLDGIDRTVRIIGRENLNRAIHSDIVAIQINPEAEWQEDISTAVEEEIMEKDEVLENEEEGEGFKKDSLDELVESHSKSETSGPVKPTARIVGIIKRKWRPYCGTIDKSSVKLTPSATSAQFVFFWAMDRRIPKIRIRTRQASSLLGKRIIVSIDSWDKNSRFPSGHFVRILGEVGDRSTETDVLLLEHDVPFTPFSQKVLKFLPPEGESWVVRDEDLVNREDFRHLDICSIDPPGCTDIDDALHAIILENDIADVSHFVKSGNEMDLEAQRRGTTVYLVDKRIDMLPSLLGTNLCSLRSNVDRLSFSCIWEISPSMQILNVRFTKSIIRSKASLTYDEAQARLDDPKMDDKISKGIKILNQIAKKLRANRIARGALTLSSPEVRFKLENDSQDPVDVEMKHLKDANALVEEFMLLANIFVAKRIHQSFPEASVLRRHPQPPITNFEALQQSLSEKGFALSASTSKSLADSLDAIIIPKDPYFNNLVRIMTTRCMMQAVYFCSGTLSEAEYRHYGLASEIYTHFTSPIRRYADLVVHRLLAASIGYEKKSSADFMDKVKSEEMCRVLNYRHQMAQQASRSSVELYTNLFFKDKKVKEAAYVIKILKNGFSVIIPTYGIEGIVYANAIDTTSFMVQSSTTQLIWENITIKLFDKVQVQISVEEAGVAAAQRSKLKLILTEPVIPGFSLDDSLDKTQHTLKKIKVQ